MVHGCRAAFPWFRCHAPTPLQPLVNFVQDELILMIPLGEDANVVGVAADEKRNVG